MDAAREEARIDVGLFRHLESVVNLELKRFDEVITIGFAFSGALAASQNKSARPSASSEGV